METRLTPHTSCSRSYTFRRRMNKYKANKSAPVWNSQRLYSIQILDCELIYNIWQYNGSIYGPYAAEAVYHFYLEGKLEFPTRIQITEVRKGNTGFLEYFGTLHDLQDLFGTQNFLPKRLSQFKGKWPLPEILPSIALAETINSGISFNLTSFLCNLTTSNYCPFVTGVDGEVPEELVLPLSSVAELGRRLLMEYSNLDVDEKQLLHLFLVEVFSPRICDICQKVMEDQHAYIIHALSLIHLENAVLRCNKVFTIESDYLKFRRFFDEVKRISFDRNTKRLFTKAIAAQQQQHSPPAPPVWNFNLPPINFYQGVPLPLQ